MRSWLLLFACNFMWALQFTCIKLVEDRVGPLFTVWAPMLLATLMLYPLVRREPSRGRLSAGDVGRFFALAVLGVFPGQVLLTWGTQRSLATNGALIVLTLPVATAILAVLLLGERMTLLRWLSFLAAIGGVLLCSGIDYRQLDLGSSYLAGNLLIFAGTMGSAYYNSYGKRVLERFSPMEMLFYSYVATLATITPLVALLEPGSFRGIAAFTARTWIGMGLLTFFHNFLSMVLFLKALDRLDAIQTALCNYLITAFGVPIAVVWLGERLPPTAWIGGALVLASTLIITVWEERRKGHRGAI